MPIRAPRICGCGHKVASGVACACEQRRSKERQQRADASRPSARARGYDSKWDKERAAYLKLHAVCVRPSCDAPSDVVDHIVPHKGDQRLFWSRSNWQALCTSCHSRWKQAMERRAARGSALPPRRWEF